ncbi:MAG: hypothetical protein K8W52_07090 [Deltaproteobacteria bacterium]|nr:hypothetical protein [Deltaproteobacteria bacterium]
MSQPNEHEHEAPAPVRISRIDGQDDPDDPDELETPGAIEITEYDVVSDAVVDREADRADSRRPTGRFLPVLGHEASD